MCVYVCVCFFIGVDLTIANYHDYGHLTQQPYKRYTFAHIFPLPISYNYSQNAHLNEELNIYVLIESTLG